MTKLLQSEQSVHEKRCAAAHVNRVDLIANLYLPMPDAKSPTHLSTMRTTTYSSVSTSIGPERV